MKKKIKILLNLSIILLCLSFCNTEKSMKDSSKIEELDNNDTIMGIGTAIKEELAFIEEKSKMVFEKKRRAEPIQPRSGVLPWSFGYSRVTLLRDTLFKGKSLDTLELYCLFRGDEVNIEMGRSYIFKAIKGDYFKFIKYYKPEKQNKYFITNKNNLKEVMFFKEITTDFDSLISDME